MKLNRRRNILTLCRLATANALAAVGYVGVASAARSSTAWAFSHERSKQMPAGKSASQRNFDSEPGLVRNMNPSFLAFVTACAVLIIGCRPAEKTATANSNASPEAERKTVEFVRRSPTDLTEHMTQWAREGWLVHSLINVTQANGAVVVRAALSRPELPKAERKPEAERKTAEFVRRSPTDLPEHMTQWAREGWLVHSLINVTQANGTVVVRAALSRPKASPAEGP